MSTTFFENGLKSNVKHAIIKENHYILTYSVSLIKGGKILKRTQKKDNDKKIRNKNGEGTFRKKGNKWEGRVSVKINGRSVQKSVSGDTEREAKDKAKALKKYYEEKEKKYAHLKIQQSEVTLEEWIKIWIKDYKRLTVAESTLAGYISKINSYIRPYFKERKIQEIDKNDIQLFVNHMATLKKKTSKNDTKRISGKLLSIKTIKDTVKILSMIFSDAEEEMDLIPYNPVKSPKFPKRKENKKKEILSIEEQLAVTNILLSEYNGIAFLTLFILGVRASELAGFLWKDLDDIVNGISVSRGFQIVDIYDDDLNRVRSERKYTELKSEASERIVPVMPILKIALANYKAEIMKKLGITNEKVLDNESIFKTKNGNTITADYLRHRLHYVLDKYGFKKHITVHELRHTFATRCLESGIDMKTLQTFLGHADYKLTANTYSHVLRQTKDNQILKYNTYITDTIQKSLEDVMNITEETVKDPKLKQKAIENMKKNFEILVEAKFKEKEEQLLMKEQEENKCISNIKKCTFKKIVRKKLAV